MKFWRHVVRWLIAAILTLTGCIWWAKRSLRRQNAVSVLTLHRVLTDDECAATNSTAGMLIRLESFAKLVAYCVAHYERVGVDGFQASTRSRVPRVAFTFDDGWMDTHRNAFPVLAGNEVPFTVFVCPLLVGQKVPFWPERVALNLKARRPALSAELIEAVIEDMKGDGGKAGHSIGTTAVAEEEIASIDSTMTWEQILEMTAAGATIGSHTNTHAILTQLDDESARAEIEQSKTILERRLRESCAVFSYPNGNHDARIERCLREAGFQFAFTTARGAWTPGCDALRVPRANICEDNIVGPFGSFSSTIFDYFVFWNGWRAMRSNER